MHMLLFAALATSSDRRYCDEESYCSAGSTCCMEPHELKWGCCPYPTATCCLDEARCCPAEFPICAGGGECLKSTRMLLDVAPLGKWVLPMQFKLEDPGAYSPLSGYVAGEFAIKEHVYSTGPVSLLDGDFIIGWEEDSWLLANGAPVLFKDLNNKLTLAI